MRTRGPYLDQAQGGEGAAESIETRRGRGPSKGKKRDRKSRDAGSKNACELSDPEQEEKKKPNRSTNP